MIGAIVQARMGSTRLPNKVLLEAAGKPLLGHLIKRLSRSTMLEQIIVATSTHPQDAAIADYCATLGVAVFRGSEHDVLDRYYQAARAHSLDVIVRVTADCPLIDPALLDDMVQFFLKHRDQYDLVTNRHPLTFPDGLDVDVMAMDKLAYAWQHASTPQQREHTVPFFWEAGLRVHNVEHPERLFEQHRWTLDYPEDYQLIRQLYDALYCDDRLFTTQDTLEYLAQHPELRLINAQYIL